MKRTILLIFLLTFVTLAITVKKLNAKKLITNIKANSVTITVPNNNDPVLGVAFHLHYPKGQTYLTHELGNFLTQNSQIPIALIKDDSLKHKLIVGISLKRTDQLPTGEGEIIRFSFSEKASREIYLSNVHVRTL